MGVVEFNFDVKWDFLEMLGEGNSLLGLNDGIKVFLLWWLFECILSVGIVVGGKVRVMNSVVGWLLVIFGLWDFLESWDNVNFVVILCGVFFKVDKDWVVEEYNVVFWVDWIEVREDFVKFWGFEFLCCKFIELVLICRV